MDTKNHQNIDILIIMQGITYGELNYSYNNLKPSRNNVICVSKIAKTQIHICMVLLLLQSPLICITIIIFLLFLEC